MRFRLLTYNIHKAIGVDRRFNPDRVAEVLRHHDADLVLLQEVDRGAPRSDHLDLAAALATKLAYQYRAAGMNVFLKRGKYGNATLSRYPIGRQYNLDLTIARRKRRGAQHTRVHVSQDARHPPVDVYNVHLGLLAAERQRQVNHLLALHDIAHGHPEHPCIIAGDMNDWRGLLGRCFAPAGFQCATNNGTWSIRTFPSFAPTGGLDKIFFRGPLRLLDVHRSRLSLARVASDHLPVIAEFEWAGPPAAQPGDKRAHARSH